MAISPDQDDFLPTARDETLRLRAELLGRVREFFERHGFLEVETPVLSADTVIDRHIEPLSVQVGEGPAARRLWLQTSPEFAMKRLLAAGATAIYQVARVFRQGELGALHNPEFTMVEWYRVGDGMAEGMERLSQLGDGLLHRGPAQRLAYAEAFRRSVGLDPHRAPTEALIAAAAQLGISAPTTLCPADRDGWLDLLLVERVQPGLGHAQPVILYDYPASQAALARVRPGDSPDAPPVAERFELYVDGVELANGYHELVDPAALRWRNAENNALRQADGNPLLPEPSRLLAAMEAGLPASTGVALGFDRVVMLAAGASRVGDVIAFPFDRA
jgi:lysyl-tRNA synthetase class 2